MLALALSDSVVKDVEVIMVRCALVSPYSLADTLPAVQSDAYGLLQCHLQSLPETRELHGLEHRPVTAHPRWESKVEELPQTRRRDCPSIGVVNLGSHYTPSTTNPVSRVPFHVRLPNRPSWFRCRFSRTPSPTRDNDAACVIRGNVPIQNQRPFIDSVSSKSPGLRQMRGRHYRLQAISVL